ncbi:MAG: HEAT repeat domain-containing protein [Coriobacteriia bacterium]
MNRRQRREAARRSRMTSASAAFSPAELVVVLGNDGPTIIRRFTVEDGRCLLRSPSPSGSARPPVGPEASPPPAGTARLSCEHTPVVDALCRLLLLERGSGLELTATMRRTAAFGEASVGAAIDHFRSAESLRGAFLAGHVLGYVRDERVIPALTEILAQHDQDIFLTYEAARALVNIGGADVEAALLERLDQTDSCSYTWDCLRSTLAMLALPNLYERDPDTVDDEDVFAVFRFWAEQASISPYRLAALAQPLEHIHALDALEHDRVTETVWRVICAARMSQLGPSGAMS